MVQFFDSADHYKHVKTPDQCQFFISNGNELCIFTDKQEESVSQQIIKKFKGFSTIIHSAYVLSDLQKPWQRKMLFQEFNIADQINAKYFVFHLHESQTLYDNLNTILKEDRLALESAKCQFALEISSRKIKNPKEYLNQIKKYKTQGLSLVLDIAHVASSGIFTIIPEKLRKPVDKSPKSREANLKSNRYKNKEQLRRVTAFTKKYGKHFDILHFADQATQFDSGKDIHMPPFAGGSLFRFENIFAGIDLLDSLIAKYKLVVVEFIDKDRLFRRALSRYIDKSLFITKDHIEMYVRILTWYSGQIGDVDYDDDNYGIPFQISTYEAIAYQLLEISKQTDRHVQMESPLWRKYCLSHKVSQLLLIVELTSYFFLNGINPPWDEQPLPDSLRRQEMSRTNIDHYIRKLTKLKIIKSTKQIYGSYLRGNQTIGDLDVIFDVKDKERVINTIFSAIKHKSYDREQAASFDEQASGFEARGYTIVRLFLDNKLNVDMYFTQLPNCVMELFLTGSKYFNIFMKRRASSLGFKLTNTELLKQNNKGEWIRIPVKTQLDVFRKLQMRPVPPQFRIFLSDPFKVYIMSQN